MLSTGGAGGSGDTDGGAGGDGGTSDLLTGGAGGAGGARAGNGTGKRCQPLRYDKFSSYISIVRENCGEYFIYLFYTFRTKEQASCFI